MKLLHKMNEIRVKSMFDRAGRAGDNKPGLIQLEIYFNRNNRRFISTGIHILKKEWDPDLQEINRNNRNYIKLNNDIEELKNKIIRHYRKCEYTGSDFTWSGLKQFLNDKVPGKIPDKKFYNYCVQSLSNDHTIRQTTKERHLQTLKIVNDFYPGLDIEQIDKKLISDFNNYLHSKNYSHNTISKHHHSMVRFINIIIEDESQPLELNPYNKRIVRSYIKTKFDFLRLMQLDSIYNLDLPEKSNIDMVRNRFLFSCYTGLRHSDINRLNKTWLRFTDNGILLNIDRMQKVNRNINMPLFSFFDKRAEDILYQLADGDFNFPSFTDDNRYLKIIAGECNIDFNLTFHVARHTFCTNLAHITNGNILLVMRYAGISKYDTAMRYIHMAEDGYGKTG